MSQAIDRGNNDNGHPDFILRAIGPIKKNKGKRRLDLEVGKYFEMQFVHIPKDGQQGAKIKFIKLSNNMLR